MEYWDKIQKDVSKGLKEGLHLIKEKAGELTDEGKRKYKTYDIKSQIHKQMAELGATLYSMKDSDKDILSSTKISRLISKISKLEAALAEAEPGRSTSKPAKKAVKKKSVKKKSAAKKTT